MKAGYLRRGYLGYFIPGLQLGVLSAAALYLSGVECAAQLVSPSKLTHTVGVKSPTTVLEYFSYFEAAYLVSLVPCFSWSAKAASTAPKKLYIVDPGIIRPGAVSFTGNEGALLENFVYNSLRLHTGDIYYFAGPKPGM